MKHIFTIEGDVWGIGATNNEARRIARDNISMDELLRYIHIDNHFMDEMFEYADPDEYECTDALAKALAANLKTGWEIRNGIARLPGEIVFESERVEQLETLGQGRLFQS